MLTSVITQKGQVTIPVELRSSLGIHPGDHLSFSRKGKNIIISVKKSKVEQSFGILKAKHGVSLEEMQKAIIAGAADDKS